ncbi:MAG: helix-turn-helix domain-containing protein [Candidatus Erginobacter occultus]|nr:helix-turn-helix domain-containing protein [Candidatus Erginobacter occultus]
MSLDPHCRAVAERLISFWERHRGFDANIAGLARAAGVSRDTVYRWLNGKALPKPAKAILVEEWLNRRGAAG